MLVSDYDLHDLLELTDRVYVPHEGHLIFSGNADELLSDSHVRQIFLGELLALMSADYVLLFAASSASIRFASATSKWRIDDHSRPTVGNLT